MSDIAATEVKKLRDMTGAGMMDCKKALGDAKGDIEKARVLLRERGLAEAAKRSGREASDGLIVSYLHTPTADQPPRIGVLLELATETDFVAKTQDVRDLARELAMHIAAARPAYVTAAEIPEDILNTERELAAKKVAGKPEKIIEQAKEGAVKKFVSQFALIEQKWVRDDKQKIGELIASYAAKTGENLSVRRFVRYEVAEQIN